MILRSISFQEDKNTVQEWTLSNLEFGKRNLIVGKNSTGKSRSLNVIRILANYLRGFQSPTGSAGFDVHFTNEDKDYNYVVEYKLDEIISEKLTINGEIFLIRSTGGVGEIRVENFTANPFMMKFQSPTKDFAVVTRRDSIQHAYLEPIFTWASSLRYYPFGGDLGKSTVAFISSNAPKPDERDFNQALGLFREATKKFKSRYTKQLIKDFALIDYKVEEIGDKPPYSVKIVSGHGDAVGLYVKETDLPGITDQFSMSTGMFRVLSLLIQVNYFQFHKLSATVLIDDIGEGLDFDRSCRLIDLLRKKAEKSDIQIIMSTNDKFVMNNVPLEEWSVLQRKSNKVTVSNVYNSNEIFNEFKFTGLSNFSLLEYDYINDVKH